MRWDTVLTAALGGAATVAVIGLVGQLAGAPLLMAAFGSSCVLIFLFPDVPLSRPVNVIGGHTTSAVAGLVVHATFPTSWWSLGLSVGLAMAVMATARVVHPPAGATPLAVMTTHESWSYLLTPVLAGAVILSVCAVLHRLLLGRLRNRRE